MGRLHLREYLFEEIAEVGCLLPVAQPGTTRWIRCLCWPRDERMNGFSHNSFPATEFTVIHGILRILLVDSFGSLPANNTSQTVLGTAFLCIHSTSPNNLYSSFGVHLLRGPIFGCRFSAKRLWRHREPLDTWNSTSFTSVTKHFFTNRAT